MAHYQAQDEAGERPVAGKRLPVRSSIMDVNGNVSGINRGHNKMQPAHNQAPYSAPFAAEADAPQYAEGNEDASPGANAYGHLNGVQAGDLPVAGKRLPV